MSSRERPPEASSSATGKSSAPNSSPRASRPTNTSAAGNGYDATASGGSNLAQSNKALVDRVQGSINTLAAENPSQPVPIDLVTTSGSGLDPDITPDAAWFQVPRIAKARKLPEDTIRKLVDSHIAPRQLGVLGEPRVNVLRLNIDLDKLSK
jgi:K+-transporting ATPase ATPase C chain